MTLHEDSYCTIETTDGDPWATTGVFKEDVPEECNVLEFEYQTTLGMSNLELFFMDVKTGIDPAHSMSAGQVPASEEWVSFSVRLKEYRKNFNWGKKEITCVWTLELILIIPYRCVTFACVL